MLGSGRIITVDVAWPPVRGTNPYPDAEAVKKSGTYVVAAVIYHSTVDTLLNAEINSPPRVGFNLGHREAVLENVGLDPVRPNPCIVPRHGGRLQGGTSFDTVRTARPREIRYRICPRPAPLARRLVLRPSEKSVLAGDAACAGRRPFASIHTSIAACAVGLRLDSCARLKGSRRAQPAVCGANVVLISPRRTWGTWS